MATARILPGWRMVSIFDTQPNTLEFQAKLQRLPFDLPEADRFDEQMRSFANAHAALVSAVDAQPLSPDVPSAPFQVSPLERRLLGMKRATARFCRAAPGVSTLMSRRDRRATG